MRQSFKRIRAQVVFKLSNCQSTLKTSCKHRSWRSCRIKVDLPWNSSRLMYKTTWVLFRRWRRWIKSSVQRVVGSMSLSIIQEFWTRYRYSLMNFRRCHLAAMMLSISINISKYNCTEKFRAVESVLPIPIDRFTPVTLMWMLQA